MGELCVNQLLYSFKQQVILMVYVMCNKDIEEFFLANTITVLIHLCNSAAADLLVKKTSLVNTL